MIRCSTVFEVISYLDGEHFVEEVIDWIMNRETKNHLEKACLLDFCLRHGGLTWENAKRLCPQGAILKAIGVTKITLRCSACRCPGHNKNHCHKDLQILSKQYGLTSMG